MPGEKVIPAENPSRTKAEPATAGRSLRRIFRQDDTLRKITVQPATVSLLMNETRLRIFAHLFLNPGDHVRSIARGTRLNLNSVSLHLSRLESSEYVGSSTAQGKRVYWPKGMVEPEDIGLLIVIRQDWAIRALKSIAAAARPLTQKEIAGAMKCTQQTADIRLKRMVSIGLLLKHGQGKGAKYTVHSGLPVRYRTYAVRSKRTAGSAVDILRKDGLMPSDARLRGTRLSLNVKVPGSNRRIHLECNPLAPLKPILSAQKG